MISNYSHTGWVGRKKCADASINRHVDHLQAPIGEIARQLEDAEGIETVTTAFAINAVGRDVKGPDRTRRNRPLVIALQNLPQLTDTCHEQSSRIRGLPMAKDAVAGEEPAHHRVK